MRNRPGEEAERWLQQAEADLGWARHLAEQGAHHLACFLSQQVAEKALKAILYGDGEEIVLGHSVERLGERASRTHPELEGRRQGWGILDTYYITARYPNGIPDSIPARVFDRKVAQEAVRLAEEVVDNARRILRGEAGTPGG